MSGCAKKPFLSSAHSEEQAYAECHRLTENKDYEDSNACFEVLKSRFGGSHAGFEADLEIGDNYFRKGDYLLAADTFSNFTKYHPDSPKAAYAHYRAGLSYLRENPKAIDRDQEKLHTAQQYLESAMQESDPAVTDLAREKWVEVRKRLARREFYVGRFYYRTGEYLSAIPRFREIVTNYTGLGLDEKSLYLLGSSYVKLAEKDRAQEIVSVFDQHFPSSPYRAKLMGELK